MSELATLFKELFDRSGLEMKEHIVCADLSRAVSTKLKGFSASTVRDWLHTPSAAGGFGLFPLVPLRFRVKHEFKQQRYTHAWIKLPPVKKVVKTVWAKEASPLSNLSYRTGNARVIPRPKSIPEWEELLNSATDSLEYSVIPLPRIPKVSDVKMSQFAAHWGFNAFPNMHGSIRRVEERLTSAAMALVTLVKEWMYVNKVSELL